MIVLIDNYDSFSYNVYQLIGSVEPDIKVVRNDEMTIKAVGQEGGYVYIFDLNRTDIPFVNESLSTDVTPAVKGKLGLK